MRDPVTTDVPIKSGLRWNSHIDLPSDAEPRTKRYREGIVYTISNNGYCGRLTLSRGWRRSQRSGCSPVKRVRELGSERRKTVRSLSGASVRYLRGALASTRGLRGRNPWCASCGTESCSKLDSYIPTG